MGSAECHARCTSLRAMTRPCLLLLASLLCSCAAVTAYDGSPPPWQTGTSPAVATARPAAPSPAPTMKTRATPAPRPHVAAAKRSTSALPPREVLLRLHG